MPAMQSIADSIAGGTILKAFLKRSCLFCSNDSIPLVLFSSEVACITLHFLRPSVKAAVIALILIREMMSLKKVRYTGRHVDWRFDKHFIKDEYFVISNCRFLFELQNKHYCDQLAVIYFYLIFLNITT
jgi:hypothetical protein